MCEKAVVFVPTLLVSLLFGRCLSGYTRTVLFRMILTLEYKPVTVYLKDVLIYLKCLYITYEVFGFDFSKTMFSN